MDPIPDTVTETHPPSELTTLSNTGKITYYIMPFELVYLYKNQLTTGIPRKEFQNHILPFKKKM
jgi:hypothetical protein